MNQPQPAPDIIGELVDALHEFWRVHAAEQAALEALEEAEAEGEPTTDHLTRRLALARTRTSRAGLALATALRLHFVD